MSVAGLWIKVCGLRTAAAIEAAAAGGANAVGFVFHEASPRNLDLATARALQAAVPAGLERVAVFMHPSQALVDDVLGTVAPDWVQTDAEDLVALDLPEGQRVIPVLRSGVPPDGALPTLCLYEGGRSGSGERADWTEASRLARRCSLVLAGGLDATNVGEAVRTVRPFGVDVSSGVECERGVKDALRIREFLRAARGAERALQDEERPR